MRKIKKGFSPSVIISSVNKTEHVEKKSKKKPKIFKPTKRK